MSDIAIKVENLSKLYKLYDDPIDRLKESFHPFRKKYHKDFYALNDINFEIKKGETVGIIGKNGAGKSTLLKILTGVLTPTDGTYKTHGKISSLLELGAGFNPEITGFENIYFNGTILGYTKEEIDKKIDNIIAFADIGEFIHQPVKTYSSGMYIRLGFAVAISIDPDILIIDEALSVGDVFFQAKCMTRMKQMMDNGVTILFVSHDALSIKSLCNRAILLDKGEVVEDGKADKVVEKYFNLSVSSMQKVVDKKELLPKHNSEKKHVAFVEDPAFEKRASFQRIQNGKARFRNIQLLDKHGKTVQAVEYNQELTLRMAVEVDENIHLLAHGYHIRDRNGVDVVYSDSVIEDKSIIDAKKGERFVVDYNFRAPLMEGNYNIACVLSIPIDTQISLVDFCDFVPTAVQFQMDRRNEAKLYGAVHLENDIEITKI